ncbi:MAG: beta propeller repeat protein [Mycobacteriales bacterium]
MRRRSGSWAVLGLAVLVLIDAALLVLALRPRHPPVATVAAAVEAASPTAPSVGTPTATAATSAAAAPATPAPRQVLLLDIAAAGLGFRASSTRSCTGATSQGAVTSDGGQSWQPVTLPVSHVLRVHEGGPGDIWVIGTGPGCLPMFFSSSTDGASWSPGSPAGSWYLLPDGVSAIHGPGGTVTPPCPAGSGPGQLDALSTRAAYLLCAGPGGLTALLATIDTGATWAALPDAPLAGTLAQAWGSYDAGYLARVAPGCTGTAIEATADAGSRWTQVGCVPVSSPELALAFAGPSTGMLAAVVSGQLLTYSTQDGGVSWRARGPG